MPISVGIVGLGQFGSAFVSLFAKHPDVHRLAICDLSAVRLAEVSREHGIGECYRSLDAICAADLDALVLITQPWFHFAHVLQALASGKHVYSAVPPVYGSDGKRILEQCDRLVTAVKRSGLIYMLGETTYFRPETVYCRGRASAGDFGEFAYGECEYWHDIDSPGCNLREVARQRWGASWDDSKRGSIPMHYPTHSVASMVSIMGAHMTSVSALGYTLPNEDWFTMDGVGHNTFGNEVAMYRISNGAIARHCEFRRVGHPGREGMRVFGTEGCFLDDVSGPKWATREGWQAVDLTEVREPLPAPLKGDLGGHGGSHAYLAHEFVRACVEQRTPRISVWDAVRYLAPGIVAHQSALRDGEPLPIPDWGDPPA